MDKHSLPLIPLLLLLPLVCCISVTGCFALDNGQCMDCHGDETLSRSAAEDINKSYINPQLFVDEKKFNNSVHHLNGINCVDCHTDIKELNFNNTVPHPVNMTPVNCVSCHEEQAKAFLTSSHMKARRKGIVMNCYACHDYHYVSHLAAASVIERGKTFCLRCHNPYLSHDWLPQKAAHFDFVECSVCHAPKVPRSIHLSFYDLMTNKSLSGDEILKVLAIKEDQFMARTDKNHDGRIDTDEFDDLVLMLRQKSIHPIAHAELVVEPEPGVHSVTKGEAVRECKQCHAPDSPFFSAVTIALSKNDGTVDLFKVDRAILEGYHTSHFAALGGTRIRLLDRIGFLMMAGAATVVCVHLVARLITIPIRKKREEDESENKKSDELSKK